MLIRIAPDMFRDDRFGCVTIQEVFQELFRTQKFKKQMILIYIWRQYGILSRPVKLMKEPKSFSA
jgi:hypothetical protein